MGAEKKNGPHLYSSFGIPTEEELCMPMRPVPPKVALRRDRAHALRCLELGGSSWKLAATTGPGQAPRLRTVPARALDRTLSELARAKTRVHLAAETPW